MKIILLAKFVQSKGSHSLKFHPPPSKFYTLSVKRNFLSNAYQNPPHQNGSYTSKKISFNYIFLIKNMWKNKVCLCQKGEKCDEIAKGYFPKNHISSSLSELYSGSLLTTFNSYSFNRSGGLCNRLLSVAKFQPRRRAVSVIFEEKKIFWRSM